MPKVSSNDASLLVNCAKNSILAIGIPNISDSSELVGFTPFSLINSLVALAILLVLGKNSFKKDNEPNYSYSNCRIIHRKSCRSSFRVL